MKLYFSLLGLLSICLASQADTTIGGNGYAYGANVGWMDLRGDVTHGVVIGQYVCSGYIFSANVGWINLGSGSPTNGIQYQNLGTNDFGVNTDDSGNLRGYAYGANIGWIRFESNGAPAVDLGTGNLSGSVWSANCGWISLGSIYNTAYTGSIYPGVDSDSDGMPDAWEYKYFGNLTNTAAGDFDSDGTSNLGEYLTGTDPTDPSSVFRIISIVRDVNDHVTLTWHPNPSFFYEVEGQSALTNASWVDFGHVGTPGNSSQGFDDLNDSDFFRVRPFRPLLP